MMTSLSDATFLLYLAIAVVSGYGAVLFFVYWWKMKGATPIFVYVTLLLLGLAICFGIMTWARSCTIVDCFCYLYAWYWPIRLYVLLSAVCAIVGHVQLKMWQTRRRG